ncbi:MULTISPECIES: hypothetical protein [unclassified Streptomyces]|uniref:hypothetical protein n=1 Tax=unclassified Streptomyces TaxID=2593676 RepID=UPI000AE5875E|nr:hypothetical protein [Streptomyces sp. NRRL S-241]
MSHRTKLRGAMIGACAAMLLAGPCLLAAPVQAQSHQLSASTAARPSTRAETFVNTFILHYKDAVLEQQNEGKSPAQVREDHFTKEFDTALYAWEEKNQDSNGVFRRQDTPTGWEINHDSATAEDEKVRVKYHFEDKGTKTVMFNVSLTQLLISDIQDM